MKAIKMNYSPKIFLFACILIAATIRKAESQPCPSPYSVGDNPDLNVTSQTNHGPARTIVLFDPSDTIQCCGVVVSWDLKVYTGVDGCPSTLATPCKLDFMVFDNPDTTTMRAKLIGVNPGISISPPATGFLTIQIPVEKQIPVKQNYVIGYSGKVNGVEYYDDGTSGTACSTNGYTCHQSYMATTAGQTITGTIGNSYAFQELGSTNRYYALRANIEKGTAPIFSNLPQTVNVDSTEAVGKVVFKVIPFDNNTLDTLTMSFIRSCPIGNYFTFNNATGEVTVAQSLQTPPYLTHTLTLEITDGCQKTTDNLQLKIVDKTTTTPATQATTTTPSSTTGGLLSTRDGQIVVGLLAATLALLIGTTVGLCCLCYQLRTFMNMGKIQPYSSPQYDNSVYSTRHNQVPRESYQPTQLYKQNNPQSGYVNEPRPPSFQPHISSHR